MRGSKRCQTGAAAIEYVVGVLVFSLIIGFLPLPEALGGDGKKSATQILVETIKRNYNGYAWAMSVPV